MSATASSTYAAGYAPGNVVDKSLSTRWSSIFADNQWIMLDLGRVKPIAGVRLTWELAYADGYRIEVANGPNGPWTTMYSTTVGNGGLDEISFSASARYIRMFGTHRAIGGNLGGFSLWEFEVFGPWTRPNVVINNMRSYDTLVSQYLQADEVDYVARALPEGYQYARGNPIRYEDSTGSRSRQLRKMIDRNESDHWPLWPEDYHVDDSCSWRQMIAINNGIQKAVARITSCSSGSCGVPGGVGSSFRNNWLYSLRLGVYHCDAIKYSGYGVDSSGFITWPNSASQFWATTFHNGLSHRDTWIAPAQFQRGTGTGTNSCLAGLLAHESLHPVLDYIDAANGWIVPTGQFGLAPWFDSSSSKTRNGSIADVASRSRTLETFIEQAITDCKVCQ